VNPEEVIRAVANAVASGRLTRKRIQQSTARVLAAKARVGLNISKLVNLEEISDTIDSPEEMEKAQETADKAVTLVKNEGNLVPLQNPANACWFILTESRGGQQGVRMVDELQKRIKPARYTVLDPVAPTVEIEQALQKASDCQLNVVAAFVSAREYQGKVALPGNLSELVTGLVNGKTPVVLVALGSPYLLRSFPGVASYLATLSTAPPLEAAAVKALLGEIPITGKLPVSIPAFAVYGDGLSVPKK
jgi:beta-N-acetylhexosaminidase